MILATGSPACRTRVAAEILRKPIDTESVRTYPVFMNLTLSVDDDVLKIARRRAEAVGKSVNQLVREYLEQLAGKREPQAGAVFEELSRRSRGDSRGWKFDREELHGRR